MKRKSKKTEKFVDHLYAALGTLFIVTTLYLGFSLVDNVARAATFNFELTGDINPKIAEAFKQASLSLEDGDTMVIHIESHGGLILSEDKIIYYLRTMKGNSTCVVDSHAFSAAAMILMNCKSVAVTPRALILFHVAQVCTKFNFLGQCTEIKPTSEDFHPEAYLDSLEQLERLAKPILTEEEWKQLVDGKNISLRGADFIDRLEKLQNKSGDD